jgi:glycosyltransferase involved in cell wall biosynthesis
MRVLIVSQCFWPENFCINDVATGLRDAGCDVTILTGQPNYPGGDVFQGYAASGLGVERWSALEINRVPIVCRGRGGALRIALNYLSFISSATVFGSYLLRRKQFDVIFVYGTSPILQAIPAILLAQTKCAATVLWVQDLWPESLVVTGFVRNAWLLSAVRAVVRWIYSRCDLILVQSEAFVDKVAAMAGTVPVVVHTNPGDAAHHKPDAIVSSLTHPFNIVFAGNLGTVQALDTILAAATLLADLNDVGFVFAGDGARAGRLAAEIERLGLAERCTMLGRLPANMMPGLFSQAAALLVTLARDPAMASTVPSKLQSYFAAGRPIIAALDGEGARLVLAAGAGVACPAEDAEALASAVRSLHALSVAERDLLGAAGRKYYAEHFAPEVLTPRLISSFKVAAATHCGRLTRMEQ